MMKKTKKYISIIIIFFLILLVLFSLCNCEESIETSTQEDIVSTETSGNSFDNVNEKPNTTSKRPGADLDVEVAHGITSTYGLMRVHFIDVGQGDCSFIELGNGQTMLIDAGNPEDGDDIVEYIKELQYGDIDYVVATHPHDDHIGGMADVLKTFSVEKMYMPNAVHTSYSFENLLNVIEEKDIDLNIAKSATSILSSGPIDIDILSPVQEEYSEMNNYSAVVRIIYGESSFLFTGDAEKIVESEILNSEIDVDVLKVGHHGSNSSSSEAFINATSPQIAVISCGQDNMYGHPDYEVLSLLDENNVKVYRTDEAGTIMVTADQNNNITVDKKASTIKENAPPENTYVVSEETTPDNKPTTESVEVVYITNTGECYHRETCSYLKSKIEVTKEKAKNMGLRPCSRCRPTK